MFRNATAQNAADPLTIVCKHGILGLVETKKTKIVSYWWWRMKTRIMMAAAEEMKLRGVKFTVDAVAEQLGISKKTLYQYWASKDEIISALCDAAVADMQQQENEILSGSLEFEAKLTALLTVEPKRFGKINEWVIDDMRRHKPDEWQKVENYRRSHIRHLQEFIAEGIRQGKLRTVNSAIAAQMILGACTEMLEYPFLRSNNLTITDALQGLTDIFLHGVLEKRNSKD